MDRPGKRKELRDNRDEKRKLSTPPACCSLRAALDRITGRVIAIDAARVPVASQPVARSKASRPPSPAAVGVSERILLADGCLRETRRPSSLSRAGGPRNRRDRCPDTTKRPVEPRRSLILRSRSPRRGPRGGKSPRLPRLYKLPDRCGNLTCTPAIGLERARDTSTRNHSIRPGRTRRTRTSLKLDRGDAPSHEVLFTVAVLLLPATRRQVPWQSLHRRRW